MNTSIPATETATAKNVKVTADALIVELRDGRTVSVPITWYPRSPKVQPANAVVGS
jgi:hypothetical protein